MSGLGQDLAALKSAAAFLTVGFWHSLSRNAPRARVRPETRDVQTRRSRPFRLRPGEPLRRNHHQEIIAELEGGRVPWVQPWRTAAAKAPLAMPKNATTSRFDSGINVLNSGVP